MKEVRLNGPTLTFFFLQFVKMINVEGGFGVSGGFICVGKGTRSWYG